MDALAVVTETEGSLSSRPLWSAELVPGQPGLLLLDRLLEFFHLEFSGLGKALESRTAEVESGV